MFINEGSNVGFGCGSGLTLNRAIISWIIRLNF